MSRRKLGGSLLTLLTWAIALVMFFPVFWLVFTSFKTEADAVAWPPVMVFVPTLENWINALFVSPYFAFFTNTVIIVLGATLLAMLLGVPAAYSLAYNPTRRSDFTLLWVMSTRMMPAVGVVIPVYIVFRDAHLLDTHLGLILIFGAANIPLVIWMMRSFFLDLPFEVLESARMDGVSFGQELRYMVLPLTMPGLTAAALLCIIFTWNEFFFAYNLTAVQASPLSVYIASFKTSEGLFWASMSAAATATVLPVILAGWVAQRQLVTGLTMGAVRE